MASLLLAAALSACGGVEPGDAESSDIGRVQESLAVADKVFTDATGDVKILVRTCDYPANATTGSRCQFCGLDQGWTMIAGGAEIEGSPTSGRLRSSMPFVNSLQPPVHSPDGLESCTGNTPNNDLSKDFTAWMGRADGFSSFRMRTYVVGLQIAGMTEADLKPYINRVDSTTDAQTQPRVYAESYGTLLGGGADEVGGRNCYLTESRPDAVANTWNASSYCSSAPGYLKAYGIYLSDSCFAAPGWDNCMRFKARSVVSGAVSGYGTASVVTPYPWVTTAIGGLGVVNGASSRGLADLIPLVGSSQGASVTTKDAGTPITGTTTAYSINVLGGRWGTYLYNVVRFADPVAEGGGLSLYRPSGAAPVSLRQGTLNDNPTNRWWLESLGGGVYRLRNSNPSATPQGECAFRQTGTSNVQVGPCGTSNEYKWTFVGDPRAPWVGFKLKNVSSSTCLDTKGSTSPNANLGLATCATDFSTRQSLYLQTLNWPS